MAVFVDVHAIQSVGPNNLNRDLNGTPKTAMYGGVRRARVSSQAWKRPMRLDFRERYSPENIGIRTNRVVELLAEKIHAADEQLDPADVEELAITVFKDLKIKLDGEKPPKGQERKISDVVSKYLILFSSSQLENAADIALAAYHEGGLDAVKGKKKELKEALKSDLSVDLALFGRMVADDADLNVDASCQVAHALSTHQVGTEFDFFTAVDDQKQQAEETDAGAGMMGTVEFDSATLYRYATVNATQLSEQLGGRAAAAAAIRGFVDVFSTSLPTGKQNTFAAQAVPELVVVSVRTDRPVSWAGAFERPVYAKDRSQRPVTGFSSPSVKRLFDYALSVDGAYGGPVAPYSVLAVGEAAEEVPSDEEKVAKAESLTALVRQVAQTVEAALEDQ